jgi:AraC-like DNA-binding protein
MIERIAMFEQTNWEKLAAEANYRPSQLAALCTVSLRTLQRHFSGRYGMTLGEWLREVRVNEAYTRLKAGESIKEVAYDLGFKQPSHFSRVFKRVHGVSPSEISNRSNSCLGALLATAPQAFASQAAALAAHSPHPGHSQRAA